MPAWRLHAPHPLLFLQVSDAAGEGASLAFACALSLVVVQLSEAAGEIALLVWRRLRRGDSRASIRQIDHALQTVLFRNLGSEDWSEILEGDCSCNHDDKNLRCRPLMSTSGVA